GGAPAAPDRTLPIGGAGESSGKTVAPESYRKKQEEENKTVGAFRQKYDLEPVVGWLACVDGPDKGKSYELYAKINTIGRSPENDVCIRGDATVSRRNHARLAYDPRHNNFRIIPDESTNNIYLNDEPIYTPSLLEAYDRVEFGQSRLIFVPLCCERFRWEEA
ncbi:MAG: FHA domain-containing protein, partial [Oscillospiraceae bacterium]|nr:FHA domain-containing protein [Oscillospiraceae bacterium]